MCLYQHCKFVIVITFFIFFPLWYLLLQVLDIISKGGVKGIAHITGGGFTDNIPRVFPEGLGALIYNDSWTVPLVFKWIQEVRIFFVHSHLWILVLACL